MKKIKSITHEFDAIIDGSTRYHLTTDSELVIPDSHADFISQRWGALVSIQEATLEEAAETIASGDAPVEEKKVKVKKVKTE